MKDGDERPVVTRFEDGVINVIDGSAGAGTSVDKTPGRQAEAAGFPLLHGEAARQVSKVPSGPVKTIQPLAGQIVVTCQVGEAGGRLDGFLPGARRKTHGVAAERGVGVLPSRSSRH